MNKIILASIVIVGIISIVSLVVACTKTVETFGGYTSGYWDSAGGYYVDGTAIIDGDGNVDGAITSGSASTFASTLGITGACTMSSSLTQSGGVVSMATTTIVGPLVSGGNSTTVDTASSTLSATGFCNASIIKWRLKDTSTEDTQADAEGGQDTIGLPSSTDMIANCIPRIGDHHQVLFYNYGTSSVRLVEEHHNSDLAILVSATSSVQGSILMFDAGEYGWIDYMNLDGTTSTVSITSLEILAPKY